DGAAAIKQLTDDINKQAKSIAEAQALKIQSVEQAALAEIELEQQKANSLFALGIISSQQRIAVERSTEDRAFAIKKAAIQAEIAMLTATDPDYSAQRQKLLNQLLTLE